jgi:hypothetical protein
MDSKKEYKKVYAIVEIGGEVKAVYEDEEEAYRIADKWNEKVEEMKATAWMVHVEEVNYFEKGY